jgi:hypothetical protein
MYPYLITYLVVILLIYIWLKIITFQNTLRCLIFGYKF